MAPKKVMAGVPWSAKRLRKSEEDFARLSARIERDMAEARLRDEEERDRAQILEEMASAYREDDRAKRLKHERYEKERAEEEAKQMETARRWRRWRREGAEAGAGCSSHWEACLPRGSGGS